MPPDMAISMRHTKLKAEEAALLAGEINKPSWESRNEGIHERISFEDSIWGFDLAGGIFYNTPLRVTAVKPDSRAEKAGIRPGDKLLRINDLDTSTLTIQQAHDIIVQSGIHLKISVTSPDDEEDSYYCYEDPLVDGYDSEEERRLEEEKAKKRRVCARVSHFWSLQWPWVSKKRLIYRESNCFMVPSKYEDAHREKYPPLPTIRFTEDIVHFSVDGENQDNTKRIPSLWEVKQKARQERKERKEKGYVSSDVSGETDEQMLEVSNKNEIEKEEPKEKPKEKTNQKSRRSTLKVERQETIDESKEEEEISKNEELLNEILNEEINEEMYEETNEEINEELNEVVNDQMNVDDNDVNETPVKDVDEDNNNAVPNDLLSQIPEIIEENNQAVEEAAEVENTADEDNDQMNGEINDDEVLNEVLGKEAPKSEDDNNILDSILSDEGQNLENSESNNER